MGWNSALGQLDILLNWGAGGQGSPQEAKVESPRGAGTPASEEAKGGPNG